MSDKPDFDIAERQYAEIRDLRAKLQAAEAMVATAHPPKMIRDLVSKLQAAEAEISDARSVAGGFVKPPFDGSLAGAIDAISMRCASAEAENDRLQARVDNLAALLRILVHSLRKVNPNSSNIVRAMDYLKRNGLTGSILRSDEPQPAEIPESGGHIESADCWCGPTVEEHPSGTLIIHNQTH